MDGEPLADVLTLASARCVRSGTLKAGGLAEQRLREGTMTVSELAECLGYDSDTAFSNAFKRRTSLRRTAGQLPELSPPR